jgi:hypothetical protein
LDDEGRPGGEGTVVVILPGPEQRVGLSILHMIGAI